MDLDIFTKFDFEFEPVGVKFEMIRPQNMSRINEYIPLCKMVRHAQLNGAFYAMPDDQECAAGRYIVGGAPIDPAMLSGQIGPKLGVYQDARANRQIYLDMKKLEYGTCKYVLFAPLSEMNFDPDVLIVIAKPSQAEIILRANGYQTGEGWNAVGTSVCGCACMLTHPYITGKLNLMVSGLHHGMKVHKIFPEGLLFLSIPFQKLPKLTQSLKEMEWKLNQYECSAEEHAKNMQMIGEQIARELSE